MAPPALSLVPIEIYVGWVNTLEMLLLYTLFVCVGKYKMYLYKLKKQKEKQDYLLLFVDSTYKFDIFIHCTNIVYIL